jgi:predicted GIY-YIG superfamily endonuclease
MVSGSAIADWSRDEWARFEELSHQEKTRAVLRAATKHISFSKLGQFGWSGLDGVGSCAYGMVNDVGSICYVGVTVNLRKRMKRHRHKLFKELNRELTGILVWEMPYADALKVEHLLIKGLSETICNKLFRKTQEAA